MKFFILISTLAILLLSMQSCVEVADKNMKTKYSMFKAETLDSLPSKLIYVDTSYIPIYSDIFSQTNDLRINLTATLSLRNTSLKYSIFISKVDYHNSGGELDKKFIEKPIELKPLQTVEYVIEEEHLSGGTGANFIVVWSARNKNLNPLFESIMISTQNRQGISFTSRGVSVKK